MLPCENETITYKSILTVSHLSLFWAHWICMQELESLD